MTTYPTNTIALSNLSFDDVDHLSEWATGVGWDIESTQLTNGDNEIRYDHFSFPELLVSHYSAKQSMQSLFALPDGAVLFLICRAKLPLVWCGRHLSPTLMGIVRSKSENWVVIPSGLDCYEFIVSENLIQRTEIFPLDFFAETTQPERALVPLTEPATGRFLQQLDAIFEQGRRANGSSEAAAVHSTRFLNFIIQGLQQLFDTGLIARGSYQPRKGRRADLVSKGIDFVSTHLTADISLHDMAQALDVSYRVLNYAFKDSLGMSPYQYVLTQKLNSVRRQLKLGAPVMEVCALHGFNNPSRFANQYWRLFGELPSTTRHLNNSGTS